MPRQTGSYKHALTAATGTTAGGVLKVMNDFGADVIVTRLVLDIATKSTGVATVDAGIHATGSASADNLIDGLDVNAAAGVFDNTKNGGTNGKGVALWPAGHYLVITASATAAGLVGNAHVEFVQR